MGTLTFKCPTTGRDFSTVINTDEASFRKLPNIITKASCPHCGRIHSRWTSEARLIGGTSPPDWREKRAS
jgi:hypothetical protein